MFLKSDQHETNLCTNERQIGPDSQAAGRFVAIASGVVASGIGLCGLVGWALGHRILVQPFASLPALHYVSAAELFVVGTTFVLYALRWRRMAMALSLITVALSTVVLVALFFGRGFDLFSRGFAALGFLVELIPAARVAPNTGLCLFLAGSALVAASWARGRGRSFLVSTFGALVFALGAIAIIGYLTGVTTLFGWVGFYGMSVHSAAAFVFVGLGLQAVAADSHQLNGSFLTEKWLFIPAFAAVEVATISLAMATVIQDRAAIEKHIEAHALALQVGISEKFDADLESINLMAKRWSGSSLEDERRWEIDASGYLREIPGLISMAWIDQDLIAKWIVPVSARAIGLNRYVGIEPLRLRTIEAARLSGQVQLTPMVDLFIGGPGVLVFSPIFRDGQPNGFINAAYRPANLFSITAPKALGRDFSFVAFEGDRTIARNLADDAATQGEWGQEIEVGRPWTTWRVQIWPTASFLAGEKGSLPAQILFGGTIFGLLFVSLILISQRAYRRRLVIERTSEALAKTVEEVSEARREADAANIAKSMFLSSMSHEIRTPLGAIIGYADLGQYLEIIERNAQDVLTLINGILDLAKIEAGKFSCHKAPTPLGEVIYDVLTTLRQTASTKGLDLSGRFESRVPAVIETDRLRLRQLLLNLVGNAIKFTAKGSVTVEVRLIPGASGALIEVTVTDTGCGIAAEHQGVLFEAFNQADATIASRFGGTGLGLSLSRNLARALGGDVVLRQSEVGKGSVFVATIDPGRLTADEMVPPGEIGASEYPQKVDNQRIPPTNLRGMRILVVDDGQDMRLLLRTLLRLFGAQVDEAKNGREGITRALAAPYDVILMDVQMPILDGEEALRELRSTGYEKPIVAVTANVMRGERERYLALGFSDHLSKPVTQESLLNAIQRYAPGKLDQSTEADPLKADSARATNWSEKCSSDASDLH